MEIQLTQDELIEFKKLAEKFTEGTLRPFVHPEYADGDLARLPQILQEAYNTGLLADAENSYGVWGRDLNGYPGTSLTLLSVLAQACAGVALCFHRNGLAFNLLHYLAPDLPFAGARRIGLALQEDSFFFLPERLFASGEEQPLFTTFLKEESDGWRLDGGKQFVYSLPDSDACLVFAQSGNGPAAALVPLNAPGVRAEPVSERLGLLACKVNHLRFEQVALPADAVFRGEKVRQAIGRLLFLDWLGLSAIALGCAEGAVASAQNYITQRYQGGTTISRHPAIQRLIGAVQDGVLSARALLERPWRLTDTFDFDALREAATVKITVSGLCSQAVSDALQCFGGYGYMEDYGMEKRFRDVHTLKILSGSPFYLKRFTTQLRGEN